MNLHSHTGCFETEMNLLPLLGFKSWIVQPSESKPEVRTRTFRGTRKKILNNGGKRHIRQKLQFRITKYKIEIKATKLITNILLTFRNRASYI